MTVPIIIMTRVNQYDVQITEKGERIHFQVLVKDNEEKAIACANTYLASIKKQIIIKEDDKIVQFVAEIGANPVQQEEINKEGYCIYKIHGCSD